MMKTRFLLLGLGTVVVGSVLLTGLAQEKAHKLQTVSLRKMADSLHAVIAANRQVYVELQSGLAQDAGLPVHAAALRRANLSIQQHGAEFSYTLRSLWPIDAAQGPQTAVEEEGLRQVAERPEEPYLTEELLGGRSYFTAVYADRATQAACVTCHNAHPKSPRQDFEIGDVMGAIVVRIPLEF